MIVVPSPSVLRAVTLALWACAMATTIASPNPAPGVDWIIWLAGKSGLVIAVGLGKVGRARSTRALAGAMPAGSGPPGCGNDATPAVAVVAGGRAVAAGAQPLTMEANSTTSRMKRCRGHLTSIEQVIASLYQQGDE